MLRPVLLALGFLTILNGAAQAQTCADQNKACIGRGHTPAECAKSTNSCLSTGRWIGPAGREFPISKKK